MAKKIVIEMSNQDAIFMIRDLTLLVKRNKARDARSARANLSTRFLIELLKEKVDLEED